MVGLYSLAHAIMGYGITKLFLYERVVFGAAALLLVFPHPMARSIGLIVFAIGFATHFIRNKKAKEKLA